jgi:hypothetical protein
MSSIAPDVGSVRLVAYADVVSSIAEQPEEASSNRRAHRRIGAQDFEWLRTARVKYGAEVRLVDVSTGGMAVETQQQLRPESTIVFELSGRTGGILVAARVLRSQCVRIDGEVRYRSACAFRRPLDLTPLVGEPPVSTHAATAAAPASPSPAATLAMAWQKVVVRYRDGRILRGFTCDFNSSRPQLHLSTDPFSGESLIVPINQLKALFFVRDFAGDPGYVEEKTFAVQPQGRRLEVTFEDGEVLVGSTLTYRPEGHGFFVHPADRKANNIRVFVSAVAVRHVRFLARG